MFWVGLQFLTRYGLSCPLSRLLTLAVFSCIPGQPDLMHDHLVTRSSVHHRLLFGSQDLLCGVFWYLCKACLWQA